MSMGYKEFAQHAISNGVCVMDVEHSLDMSIYREGFSLHGCGFATGEEVIYIKDKDEMRYLVNAIYDNCEVIAHNAKYDCKCMIVDGIVDRFPPKVRCTQIAMNLIDETLNDSELGLKPLVLKLFGYEMNKTEDAASLGLDDPKFIEYALDDVIYTLKLWEYELPKLHSLKLWDYYTRIVLRSIPTISEMEMFGIKWSIPHAKGQYDKLAVLRDKLYKEIRGFLGNVNPNSGKQLSDRMFGQLGYSTKYTEKGKSGSYCVDDEVLSKMANKYPVCGIIGLYRTCNKLISTNLEPLSKQAIENKDHRVHPNFWLTSATGRLRSSNPNLQNQPNVYGMQDVLKEMGIDIRSGFIPQEGWRHIVYDFSQLELRIFAKLSNDKTFTDAFQCWECRICGAKGRHTKALHACPKCGVAEDEKKGFWHGLDLHQTTTDNIPVLQGKRSLGKVANFALIYFATEWRMHYDHPDLSIKKWKEAIDGFMNTYTGVRKYHEKAIMMLKQGKSFRDLFGRRRYISPNEAQKSFKHACNQVINFPTQATGSGMVQISANKLRDQWIEEGIWGNKVKLILNVHDELCAEAHESVAEKASYDMKYNMENCVDFGIPIFADGKILDTWGAMKS